MNEQKSVNKPYIINYYNPTGYFLETAVDAKRVIGRIINAFIKGLNERDRLPKFLVVTLDKEIIDDLNYFDFGAAKGLATHIQWLVKHIDIMVRRKKLQIIEKRPGAVVDSHPTVIYTTMIRRVDHFKQGSRMEAICSLRPKFNELLSEIVTKSGHKLLTIKGCNTSDHFNRWGDLSPLSKETFWLEIDDLIHCHDLDKVLLLPKLHLHKSHQWHDNRGHISRDYRHRDDRYTNNNLRIECYEYDQHKLPNPY